jgi:hypothetical protein
VLGTTSPPQTVQLSASYAISITSIETSAEFGQTNNCGKGLPPGGKCQILLTLTPTASGPQNGSLTINDGGADSPQTGPLSGTGDDFSLAPSVSSTQTVAPGQVANYTVAVAPLGGLDQTVTLSCSGAPAPSICSISLARLRSTAPLLHRRGHGDDCRDVGESRPPFQIPTNWQEPCAVADILWFAGVGAAR